MNIFVGNLSYSIGDESLRALFTNYGKVQRAHVVIDRETRRSRGFGFVEMPDAGDASEAIRALNQQDFCGRRIFVAEARPRGNGTDRGYAPPVR